MITSIKEQMAKFGISIDASAYSSCSQAMLSCLISTAPFLTFERDSSGNYALWQKGGAAAMSWEDAAAAMQVSLPDGLPDSPWFCTGLEQIAEAKRCGRPIAVEGGPCLFGADEVLAEVICGSAAHVFDYSTGKHYDSSEQSAVSFAAYLAANADEVQDIRFLDRKAGVTSQEHDSIAYLFQIAQALQARVVLPLPDMSYIKYLRSITRSLPEAIAEQTLHAFSQIAYRITELYITEAEKIAEDYPDTPWCAVHEQSESLCQQYYEARAPYIERRKILHSMTNNPDKLESIKDYISMPALPLYLYGITDVLQVDSLDEIDSFRKCRHAHRRDMKLACMLYPERLSADGVNTIFEAPLPYKEYR